MKTMMRRTRNTALVLALGYAAMAVLYVLFAEHDEDYAHAVNGYNRYGLNRALRTEDHWQRRHAEVTGRTLDGRTLDQLQHVERLIGGEPGLSW